MKPKIFCIEGIDTQGINNLLKNLSQVFLDEINIFVDEDNNLIYNQSEEYISDLNNLSRKIIRKSETCELIFVGNFIGFDKIYSKFNNQNSIINKVKNIEDILDEYDIYTYYLNFNSYNDYHKKYKYLYQLKDCYSESEYSTLFDIIEEVVDKKDYINYQTIDSTISIDEQNEIILKDFLKYFYDITQHTV